MSLTVGIVAKTKREACGLTQAELAKKAKVSAGTISRYETGMEVGEIYSKAIEDCLDQIYHSMTNAAAMRAHLRSLVARLEYCNIAEAKDVSVKIIQATAKMQWLLFHQV